MIRSRSESPGSAATRLLLAAALAVAPAQALAGTIGFKTDVEVTAGPGVDAKVTLTQTGDEAASNVRVRAELLDRSVDGEEVSVIAPTQTHTWNIHLFDQVPKGIYTLLLRTRYTDDNGYPFEVISNAVAQVGVTASPRVFGSMDIPRLPVGGEVSAVVTAKKPPGRSGDFEVSLVVPDGVDVKPSKAALVFDGAGKATARFTIGNRRLLSGTSVNIFAIVRGKTAPTAQGETFPQDDSIRGTLSIGSAEVKVTASFFYRIAGAIGGLLVLMEAGAWLQSRRTQGA